MGTRIVIKPTGRKSFRSPLPVIRGMEQLISNGSRKRPFFSSCWISPPMPIGAEVVESYCVKGAEVSILSLSGGTRFLYHLVPWEYNVPDEWMGMLRLAVDDIFRKPPDRLGASMDELRYLVVSRTREVLGNLIESNSIGASRNPMERMEILTNLSEVVGRYTVGFGLLEVLLSDDRIEDIFIDAPCSLNHIHVSLGGVGDDTSVLRCPTNIVASDSEIQGLASRLRQMSGKPFSQAFPVMETDIPNFQTRATLVAPPLSPAGIAVALRRRSRIPWTLPRMVENGTLDSTTAGLLSFLMDGCSTVLIAGARGSGKSSLLSAMLFEFPLSQRILTIEDTAELPVKQMQEMGFNVQSLVVEHGMGERMELKTEEALRVSLRLGESAIILGEVRGKEAQTLYEGMRTGRAGSSVLGTIHGDSARSVFERVVHDMGIAPEAFGATDVIVTMGLLRPHGAQRQIRCVMEIAELAKDRGPGEFNTLGRYDLIDGRMELNLKGSDTMRRISESWGIEEEQSLENIMMRTRIRDRLVNIASKRGPEFLSPLWLCRCNEFLWKEMTYPDSTPEMIEANFNEWLVRRVGAEDIL
ncbi:MAG: type II/IV secretion system ATPase subunit [Methanomassiliicoccales archaeon]|nr:type II/IV secretion system ATPase subunit [Methanomassiliicoccales archaeon]NYT15827.1 type II/IV secretion system ATPase subunit [Methanomassiliicoccales archaeon]